MKKELLQHYCTWLFDILFELERELDMTGYTVNDRRVFGFVSERLLDAWLTTNNISFEELSIVTWSTRTGCTRHSLPQAQILPEKRCLTQEMSRPSS